MALLGRERGTQVFRDLDEHPDDETFPGVVVLRLDGGLFFATAEALEERVRAFTDEAPPLEALVLDLEGVNFIDSQGAQADRDPRARRGRRRRRCASRASSRTCSPCSERTASRARSVSTTCTATSIGPSRRSCAVRRGNGLPAPTC